MDKTDYYNKLHNQLAVEFKTIPSFIRKIRSDTRKMNVKELIKKTIEKLDSPYKSARHRWSVKNGTAVNNKKPRRQSLEFYKDFLSFLGSLTNSEYDYIIKAELAQKKAHTFA